MDATTGKRPFQFAFDAQDRIGRLFGPTLESVLAFPELNRIYGRITRPGTDTRGFSEKALDELDVEIEAADAEIARVPRTGPLIVVANHPFGGLDGLILTALLQRVRSDVRLLANFLLNMIPELRETFLFVDPFGSSSSTARNVRSMKTAIRWVTGGGALGVFPAGEVSQFIARSRSVVDPAWSITVARLARQTGAAVLPVFFDGRNSLLFQTLGLIHPRLRTLMLPRELLKKRHGSIRVRIGNVIPPDRLARFADAQGLTDYLRVRTYVLRGRPAADRQVSPPPAVAPQRRLEPVAQPVPADLVSAEVAAIPAEQRLAASGDMCVMFAPASQIPNVLREIGRLREITFRAAGEGSGKPLDLDRFDPHYLHLFAWNLQGQEIVGGYRMGLTDQLFRNFGIEGLYTSTLFHYREGLLDQLGPALELGRSFVRQEYQKEYGPLSLLWKGIGHFVARHPRYRMLFGPVSISNDYQSLSKQLLVTFLKLNRYLPKLGRLIEPRNEPRFRPIGDWEPHLTGTVVRDIDGINELVAEIEEDRLSMPVLLRQYLKLNANMLGVNIDPDFGHVVDALMLVDLANVQRPILNRYLGRQGAQDFLAFHSPPAMDRVG